jgi:hypothetical protein
MYFITMPLAATINAWMVDAVQAVVAQLTFSSQAVASHQLLNVAGWSQPALRQSIARYLVGLRVNAITAALAVRCDLTDSPADTVEVWDNVVAIVGATGTSLNANEVSTRRNPWIAEALWHLCMAASRQRGELHPPGQVLAVSLPHVKTTDPGLDLAVLFHDGVTHGLSVIETKAYENNVTAAMNSCIVFFREIDGGLHNPRLRQIVSTLRGELADQAHISDGLWKDRRCYFPNVHYDNANLVDWGTARAEFVRLVPGPANIFIMPHAIAGFSQFFTQIADQMRIEAHTLSNV